MAEPKKDELVVSDVVIHETFPAPNLATPAHYAIGSIEPIDLILSQNMDFLQGNLIKYSSRFPHKGSPIDDLKKVIDYAKRIINEYDSGRRKC
ncbi:MAG: DUF3310 domain-containing protein [Planctomycetaceae bacterium]|jgi:hypothetical protein|nr:DUF3310 domain-containing protein [Planctomycetaceae bacterium]